MGNYSESSYICFIADRIYRFLCIWIVKYLSSITKALEVACSFSSYIPGYSPSVPVWREPTKNDESCAFPLPGVLGQAYLSLPLISRGQGQDDQGRAQSQEPEGPLNGPTSQAPHPHGYHLPLFCFASLPHPAGLIAHPREGIAPILDIADVVLREGKGTATCTFHIHHISLPGSAGQLGEGDLQPGHLPKPGTSIMESQKASGKG